MTEANLATVKAIFAEFLRGEDRTAFATYDDAVVWDARATLVPELANVFHGHEGVREWWRRWLAAWDRIEITGGPEHHSYGNQIVSIWSQSNIGSGSGVAVAQEAALVWTFLGGKIVHVAAFLHAEDALRAVGVDGPG